MADTEEQTASERINLSCSEDSSVKRRLQYRMLAEQDTAQSHQDDAEEDAQQFQGQPEEPAPAPAQQHHQLVTVGSGSSAVKLYPAGTCFPACTKADDFMSQPFLEHPAGQQYVQATVQLTWGAASFPFDQVRATAKSMLQYAEENFCVEGSDICLLLAKARADYNSGAGSLLRCRGGFGQPPPKFCVLHGTINHITSMTDCKALGKLTLSFGAEDHRSIRLMLQHSSQEYLVHRRDVDDKWGKISDMSMQVGALKAVNDGLREQLQQSAEREQQLKDQLVKCHKQLRHCKCNAR
ncbi:hypothetical protein OEZ85_009622 [Tetradesmus obliquus]|uniref:Uncharacterized protein n=1 Tax=Tetradesmus obliquus TaxID=3088 RepID=A0ABY8U9K3_TETOB|nr:hypothetical protein OEZ85_009622 [Tetradesmus obliquus]